jgi:hypothetical protein
MRRSHATRYARWSALTALLILVVCTGMYARAAEATELRLLALRFGAQVHPLAHHCLRAHACALLENGCNDAAVPFVLSIESAFLTR